MKDWIDFVKSLVRPFIIIWGFVLYGICVINRVEVPPLLSTLVTAIIIEYFGERALLRLTEKK